MKKDQSRIASKVYFKILEYGSNKLHEGITYPEIKENLINDGLFREGQDQSYLLDWFNESFYHRESDCKCPRTDDCGCNQDDPCEKFDHNSNCKHHINSESCMNLLHLVESENNKEITDKSMRITKYALLIALIALVSPIIDTYSIFTKSSEEQSLEQIKSDVNKIQNESQIKSHLNHILSFFYDTLNTQNKAFLEHLNKFQENQIQTLKKLTDIKNANK